MKVVIFGAMGGMGRSLYRQLDRLGLELIGADIAASGDVRACDVLALSGEILECTKAADLVVLSVPDAVACQAAGAIADLLPPDAGIADCTSVKAPYVAALRAKGRCGLVSINPLFGPDLDWDGQDIVLTQIRMSDSVQRFGACLERTGARVIRMNADEHDKTAARIQAMMHAAILSYVRARGDPAVPANTPLTRVTSLLAARITSADPKLYWYIQQANPHAAAARRNLVEMLAEFDEICANDDYARFLEIWTGIKSYSEEAAEQVNILFNNI